MLKLFSLATRLFWRDWRVGEWTVIFLALLFAITAVTSIHFFTDRLVQGLEQQGAKFLGGDLVVTSPTAIPDTWIKEATRQQLKTAFVWSYPSVISKGTALQLVNLQAVSADYPILNVSLLHPAEGTVWVEPRLLPLLSAKLGDTVTIGVKSLQISRLLTPDVDALNTGWAIAPRLLMRLEDVAATQTVLPGSRVEYRLLLAGNANSLRAFRVWITPQLTTSQTLLDVHNQKFALLTILDRTNNYLQLVLLACLIMSGVAIALSVQQYIRRHTATIALWRCLGAKQIHIEILIFYQLSLLALLAGTIGVLLGFVVQTIFTHLFQSFVLFPLPEASLAPVMLGFGICLFLLLSLAFPLLTTLPKTSPLVLWRENVDSARPKNKTALTLTCMSLALFIAWFLHFSSLALYFLGTVGVSILCLYGLSLCLLRGVRSLITHMQGALRRGLQQLLQHQRSVSLQFVGFNLILITLLVVGLIRSHLMADWQSSLSTVAPNYFAINIAPTDLTNLQQFFQQHHTTLTGIYPMVRGRLSLLNGQPILAAVPVASRGNNALHRELNLSWMLDLPTDNKIVQGRPLGATDEGKPVLSIEKQLAADLQVKVGDALTFQIGDQTITAKIQNIRSVDWSSFHPNFFIVFPPGLLDALPSTYISSFHLAAEQTDVLNQLVQRFPNITVIDVANLLLQIQNLLNKLTLALQYLFLFALASGILIFITSLQASLDERRLTYRLLHILGASRRYIWQSVMVEFTGLFLMIGISATVIAYMIVYILIHHVFTINGG